MTLHEINSQWSINLHVKCKTLKLEGNRKNLDDLRYSSKFLDVTQEGIIHERNFSLHWTSLQAKTFALEDSVKRLRR